MWAIYGLVIGTLIYLVLESYQLERRVTKLELDELKRIAPKHNAEFCEGQDR